MSYAGEIPSALSNPGRLEDLYRQARRAGGGAAFAEEIERRYQVAPSDPLLAAWHFRLQGEAAPAAEGAAHTHWRLAVGLSVALSMIYWWLVRQEADSNRSGMPLLFFMWAPPAACLIIAFLLMAGGRAAQAVRQRGLAIAAAIAVLALYAYWLFPGRASYRDLMFLHLPIVAWMGIAWLAAGPEKGDRDWFAFLLKSAEAAVAGGLFLGAAGVFVMVTVGLFEAIGVTISDSVARFMVATVSGLVPVLAVAVVYNPELAPARQRFDLGLTRLIGVLGRLFVPLTIVVGVIYVLLIPANFWRPFEQREVLIVYNMMLFAVIALLVFATPVSADDVPARFRAWLRAGILAVAALAVLVSIYALSATAYRTVQGGLTINRLTIIGWNVINIGVLVHLLWGQVRQGAAGWPASSHRTARLGMLAYTVWALFLALAIPWLF